MGSQLKPITALLCLLVAGSTCAQNIGRLFTTPEQRAGLDRMRYAGTAAIAVAGAAQVTPAPVVRASARAGVALQPEQFLVVNGIVRRSGPGRSTTWVNSKAYFETARTASGVGFTRGPDTGSATLTLRSGRQVSAKPGQHVNADSGRTHESYLGLPVAPVRVVMPADPSE